MQPYLWTEHYRPKTLDQYVWKDSTQRSNVEEWIKEGALPHTLFSGVQGTGKTSLAKLLLRMLNIPAGDIMEINASRERKVDELTDRIIGFCSTWALNDTGFKYVLLDEADSLSPLSQKFLRGEMEKFEASCRFLMTCNYPQKIIPALHSRVQEMKFSALDRNDFIARVGEILVTEEVKFEVEDLLGYVEMTYPDLRKCIGLVQQYTQASVLASPPSSEEQGGKDYLLEMVNLFKQGKFLDARKLIVSQAQIEEYVDIYRFLYRNLHLFGDTQDKQDDALIVIRRGLCNHSIISDAEINLSATLVELARL